VTNHLFRKPGQPFGVDLAAFNMQRGREFGLPSYMEYRYENYFCGRTCILQGESISREAKIMQCNINIKLDKKLNYFGPGIHRCSSQKSGRLHEHVEFLVVT